MQLDALALETRNVEVARADLAQVHGGPLSLGLQFTSPHRLVRLDVEVVELAHALRVQADGPRVHHALHDADGELLDVLVAQHRELVQHVAHEVGDVVHSADPGLDDGLVRALVTVRHDDAGVKLPRNRR